MTDRSNKGLDFWMNLGKSVAIAKALPSIVSQAYDWAMNAPEGEIDNICEVLPPVHGRALRRAIAAVRNEPATLHAELKPVG